jgi:hypothetical protein
MGFAVIMILVSIIGLIFLSFFIGRGEPVMKTSAEISDFLQASMYSTTNCTTTYIPQYKNIQDLIKSCYRNENCVNIDEKACDVLKNEYDSIIKNAFQVSDVSKNKAYTLEVYYEDLTIEGREWVTNFTDGNFENCSSEAGASHAIFMNNGNINVELNICYGL